MLSEGRHFVEKATKSESSLKKLESMDLVNSKHDFYDIVEIDKVICAERPKNRVAVSYGIIYCYGDKVLICRKRFTPEFCKIISSVYTSHVLYACLRKITQREVYLLKNVKYHILYHMVYGVYPDEKSKRRFRSLYVALNRLLGSIFRRKTDRRWEFPKGRMISGESPIDSALREFGEETGIDTNKLYLVHDKPFSYVKKGSDDNLYISYYYITSSHESLVPNNKRDKEMSQLEFVHISQLKNYINISRFETSE